MTKINCDVKKCKWNKEGECSKDIIDIHEFKSPLGTEVLCMCVYIPDIDR